jgi:iron complex outermembrane receptor protein
VALEFRPTDDILTYGSVTSGFKSGGFFGDFTFDQIELEPFDSETVTAYELGAKATLSEGNVQLNGAVFYYDYEDIQTVVPAGVAFKLDNLDGADIYGAEIELLASPLDGLDLRLGASYLDTDTDSKFAEFDGNELPNSPETQFTGTVRYEFGVTNALNLAFQVDAKYSDEMYRESTNNPFAQIDSYTLVHGRISLLSNDGKWEVAAWGKNLTDEEYDQERFFSDFIGMVSAGQGTPRQYGMTLNYNL